ncbi:hypothetical protein VTJ49DRAFT_5598 [Mycothermus thermophilus]|uniref:Uncharacterized protein n=1 Tax=Humicola insolens TaxID=85995 RepID=A0ABR3VKQ0_HUMIN
MTQVGPVSAFCFPVDSLSSVSCLVVGLFLNPRRFTCDSGLGPVPAAAHPTKFPVGFLVAQSIWRCLLRWTNAQKVEDPRIRWGGECERRGSGRASSDRLMRSGSKFAVVASLLRLPRENVSRERNGSKWVRERAARLRRNRRLKESWEWKEGKFGRSGLLLGAAEGGPREKVGLGFWNLDFATSISIQFQFKETIPHHANKHNNTNCPTRHYCRWSVLLPFSIPF